MADLYSYSKLSTFTECPRNYFYTYICGDRGGESIYTYLGTVAHDLAEAIDLGKTTNDEAVARFKNEVENTDMLGFTWITEKSKINYIECVIHFLQNHQRSEDPNLKIEDVFAVQIGEAVIWGFIDKWRMTDDTIYITDYKTSSKFSGADLEHKKLQLYIYAEALQRYYPKHNVKLQFDMMKYANNGRCLKERNELLITSEYSDGLVEFDYTDECKAALYSWVNTTVGSIDAKDKGDILAWEMTRNPEKDFFCRSLCSHYDKCKGV